MLVIVDVIIGKNGISTEVFSDMPDDARGMYGSVQLWQL